MSKRLETGFTILEAVVVVGVLLALAVGAFFAYGPIVENAKRAKVKSAASEIHTGVVVASIDGDPSTEPQSVIDAWNASTDQIRVEILDQSTAIAAMTTAGDPRADKNGDFCVQATNAQSPYIKARQGSCEDVETDPDIDGDGITNASDPDVDGDGKPNNKDSDIDGDGIPNTQDDTPSGTNPLDPDIDHDGLPNGVDPDVDGDGIPNSSDPDIDGDGLANALDEKPSGYIVGPKYTDALGGEPAIDPRVKIINGKMSGGTAEITVETDTTGIPTFTGPYYGISSRVTCQLPDGTQYYQFGYVWTQYTGKTPTVRTFSFSCSTIDNSITVGYIAGTFNGAPELTEPTGGTKGPINVISEGLLAPLSGNTAGVASASSFTDPRISLRKVSITTSGLTVGVGLNLGGAPYNSNPFYGISTRLTCKLADGSTFYHYPTLYTSYNGKSYPAPNHTFTCPSSGAVVGYVVGSDGGSSELIGSSGQRGPTNVLKDGQMELSGNDTSIAPPNQNYSDARLSVRKVTLSGGVNATVGLSIDTTKMNSSGAYFGYSARLTCENLTTGAKTYKTTSLYSLLTRSTGPIVSFNSACPTGTKAIGYVVGPYLGTPVLTSNPTVLGPTNVVTGGVQ
jgi:Tfp pilus assembly protein PilE